MNLLVHGVNVAHDIAQTKTFAPFRGAEVWPRASGEQAIKEFIRDSAETMYHPIGTCRMGSDSMAVVDNQLRVRGIEGLRVVDASIMPSHITGHPNAAIIMTAEKASDLIRQVN
jgi:choline dehydrogenase